MRFLRIGSAEGGNRIPFSDEESVSRDGQRGVMMKSAPAACFIVAEPEFLLQFLIVALNPPAQLGQIDEIPQRHNGRQSGQPALREFGRPHRHRCKTRRQLGVAAFTSGDRDGTAVSAMSAPIPWRIPAYAPHRVVSTLAGVRCRSAPRRLGRAARRPDAGQRWDAGDRAQTKLGDAIAEVGLPKGGLWFSLKRHIVNNSCPAALVRIR
jgi:hypothetical protein